MSLNNFIELAKKQTGTGRFSALIDGTAASRIMLEFIVDAIGATPTVTFTIQGSMDNVNWVDMQYVTLDSSVAASKAGIVMTTVSVTHRFVDGLDKRFPHYIAVNVSANTNVTFSARTRAMRIRAAHSLSMLALGCRRRDHELEPVLDRDVFACWCGARLITGLALAKQPWLTQPGWQVAVGTRTPRIFRARQTLAHIFRR